MDPHFSTARTPGAARQSAEEMESEAARSRFQLQAVLGKGAYGTVYRAFDSAQGELVAIKVIAVADQEPEELKQIQKEIAFLADCDHPNVVHYVGSYRHPSELWIVMEYCGGGSVNDLLAAAGEPLAEDLIAYICTEALKGLAYLHGLGKVHRDIKCGNILLTSTGDVKIADFGVSAQLTTSVSKRHTFIGTPHWMAPEVIEESRYDGKVDLWALGISAIEMAEMTPPLWNVHPVRVIFMISREPPPRLAQPERWSPVFHDFISQALVKDAKQRPTARYLLQHRFTMAQRPGVAAGLQPLIKRAVQYLQEAYAATQRLGAQDIASTGRFSWKAGTVRSQAPGAGAGQDGMGDAGGATMLMVPRGGAGADEHGRAARAGRPRQPQSSLPGTPIAAGVRRVSSSAGFDGTVVVKENYSGTVVVHNGFDTVVVRSDGGEAGGGHPALRAAAAAMRSPMTPQPVGAADYGATMVVAQGGTVVDRAGTAARHSSETGQADDDGGGYLAAVRAAAVEVQQRDRPLRPAGSPAVVLQQPQLSEVERVRERLHSIYDGGLVIPLPFLKAEQAQPLALLNASGSVPPQQQQAAAGAAAAAASGRQGQPMYTRGATLRQQAAQQQQQQQGNTAAAIPADTNGVDREAYGVVLELVQQSAGMALQRGELAGEHSAAIDALPSTVLTQLLFHPGLQNLARTLAYNRRCLAQLPLDRSAQAELQDSCKQLSAALQCVLSL